MISMYIFLSMFILLESSRCAFDIFSYAFPQDLYTFVVSPIFYYKRDSHRWIRNSS